MFKKKKRIVQESVSVSEKLMIPNTPDRLVKSWDKVLRAASSGKFNRLEILSKVYSWAEEFHGFISQYMACTEGCSYCCKAPVYITEIEAKYIAFNTAQKMERRVSATASFSPCPLLGLNEKCSVYDSRPFICRTYFTFDDSELCKVIGAQHKVYGTYDNPGNVLYMEAFELIEKLNGGFSRGDIRTYFKGASE